MRDGCISHEKSTGTFCTHPRRASQIPALCKSKALETVKTMINYYRVGLNFFFFLLGDQTVSTSVGVGRATRKQIAIVIVLRQRDKTDRIHFYAKEQRQVP